MKRVLAPGAAGLALGAAGLVLAACGGSGQAADPSAPPSAPPDDALTGTLTVFAAASLTDVFEELGARLEAGHPGLDVRFSFAGSSALAQQIVQGAPADVFASAADAPMTTVAAAGLAEAPEVFARNPLVVAVPVDNPAGIAPPEAAGIPGLADLLRVEDTVAVCAPEVPCGAAAAEVLDAAGLAEAPDTFEDDVRAVLTKVELGEVDAGLVYVSDVHAAGDAVLAYAFGESAQAVNRYPVAVLSDAPNAEAAQAFADLLLSEEGRQALAGAGFQEP